MTSVLAEAVARGGNAVVSILRQQLSGLPCTVVERAYPGELVLGFGAIRESPRAAPTADWMLYSRATPWDLETPAGVTAASRRSLSDRALSTVRRHLLDLPLLTLESRLSPAALTLSFNGAALSLKPQRGADDVAAWSLAIPDGHILRAWHDGSFDIVSGDAPFDGEVPERERAVHVALSARKVDVLATYLATWVGMRKVLWSAAGDLGWAAYEPRLGEGPDAILITPDAGLVVVEVKRALNESGALLHLERFVSERLWSEQSNRLPARGPRATADVPVISKQQLTEALAEFAAAA